MTETQSTDLLQETGNQPTSDWKDGVERELRFSKEGNDRLARFNDPSIMATSYLRYENSQNDRVKIPTDESSAEEKSAFYNGLGRPEKPDGYTQPKVGEGQEVNKEFFGGMSAIAHEAGITDSQFSKMAERYVVFEQQIKEAEVNEFNRYKEEADRKLHETYGADYDANIELSKRAYTEYASDELKALLDTDKFVGIRNEPAFIDMMVNIGKKNMDDTFVKGDGQPEIKKDDFVPNSPNSPGMYANGDDEYSAKCRAYFRVRGHNYEKKD